MWRALGVSFLICCGSVVHAQAPAPKAEFGGLETSWEIAPAIQEISTHATRLLPLLDQIDAHAWVAKGASETYAAQVESSKQQARALASEAKALAANPEKLSAALQVLFRIEGLESMAGSLEEAMRKYQSPAEAQKLASIVAENGANRNRLQRYVVNLAAQREEDLEIMDREAQRCRGILTQAPPKPGRKK